MQTRLLPQRATRKRSAIWRAVATGKKYQRALGIFVCPKQNYPRPLWKMNFNRLLAAAGAVQYQREL